MFGTEYVQRNLSILSYLGVWAAHRVKAFRQNLTGLRIRITTQCIEVVLKSSHSTSSRLWNQKLGDISIVQYDLFEPWSIGNTFWSSADANHFCKLYFLQIRWEMWGASFPNSSEFLLFSDKCESEWKEWRSYCIEHASAVCWEQSLVCRLKHTLENKARDLRSKVVAHAPLSLQQHVSSAPFRKPSLQQRTSNKTFEDVLCSVLYFTFVIRGRRTTREMHVEQRAASPLGKSPS